MLRKTLAYSASIAALALLAAASAAADTSSRKIAFSNNYAGNSWRQAMLKSYDIVTKKAVADKVVAAADVFTTADKEVPTQAAQIQNLILQGYDAIVINEYSLKPRLSISYARMNFLAKPFDNLHIRQAFALSIDRDTINNTLFKDTRTPTYHLIPQGMLGYNPNLTVIAPAGRDSGTSSTSLPNRSARANTPGGVWRPALNATPKSKSTNSMSTRAIN